MRSKPRIKNRIPMRHSTNPKRIKKVGKLIKEIVCSKRAWTSPLAGERPKTLSAPNQKKTTNKANLAKGISILLKNRIIVYDIFKL